MAMIKRRREIILKQISEMTVDLLPNCVCAVSDRTIYFVDHKKSIYPSRIIQLPRLQFPCFILQDVQLTVAPNLLSELKIVCAVETHLIDLKAKINTMAMIRSTREIILEQINDLLPSCVLCGEWKG